MVKLHKLNKTSNLIGHICSEREEVCEIFAFQGDRNPVPETPFGSTMFTMWLGQNKLHPVISDQNDRNITSLMEKQV